QMLGDGRLGGVDIEAVEKVRIEGRAGDGVGLGADGEAGGLGLGRQDDRDHRQIVFAGEVEVALVVGRAAEDGAGSVVHQNEIGDVDGQRRSFYHRVFHGERGAVALLFGGFDRFDRGAHAAAFGDELGQRRVGFGQIGGQRVVGREGDEGGTEQGVGAGGEDFDGLVVEILAGDL